MSDMKRFRDELPFGNDVLHEIRNDVMQQIQRESRHVHEWHWLGILLRTSFAALALIVFGVWQTGESPSRPVVEPARPPLPIASNPSETRRLEDPETPRVRHAARRRTRITRPVPEPAFAEPAAVRIELHTSNPDVRILWINQPSGETR